MLTASPISFSACQARGFAPLQQHYLSSWLHSGQAVEVEEDVVFANGNSNGNGNGKLAAQNAAWWAVAARAALYMLANDMRPGSRLLLMTA